MLEFGRTMQANSAQTFIRFLLCYYHGPLKLKVIPPNLRTERILLQGRT